MNYKKIIMNGFSAALSALIYFIAMQIVTKDFNLSFAVYIITAVIFLESERA